MEHWFALHVRSNSERLVETALADAGLVAFYPSRAGKRQIGSHQRDVQIPFFPGYVFCRFAWCDRLTVLRIHQVVQILAFQKEPVGIPDSEIEAVRLLAQSELAVSPYPYLKSGDPVRVVRGALAGLEGFVEHLKGKTRIIVSVHMLGRSVSAEIDQETIEPIALRLAA